MNWAQHGNLRVNYAQQRDNAYPDLFPDRLIDVSLILLVLLTVGFHEMALTKKVATLDYRTREDDTFIEKRFLGEQ